MRGLLCIVLAAVSLSTGAFVTQQPLTIQGTVSDLGSGQPLANALIVLSGDGGYFRTNTDASGRFVIEAMAAGDYKVEVTRDGYFWSKRQSGPATVTVSQDLRNLTFRLLKASAISGRILNEYGDPDPTVGVMALRLEYRNGIRVLNFPRPVAWSRISATTDRNGDYRLYGLEPGEYYLRAGSRSGGTYYPGTTDPNLAVPVSVPPGRDLTGVGMTLLRAKMYSVNAALAVPQAGTAGRELTSLVIGSVRPRDTSAVVDLTAVGSSQSSIDPARYSARLLPGDYELSMTWPTLRLFGGATFTIKDQDVDLGTIAASPGITIAGRIRMADSRSELKPMALLLTPVNSILGGANGNTTAGGTVNIQNVPDGQYWLEFRTLPRDVYVESIHYGVRAPGVGDIAVGKESEGPIEIVLATGSTVAGTVRNSRGEIVPYSNVLIYPARGRQHPTSFKTAEADKNGSFAFYGVAPGEHRVLAWEDALPSLHRDPKFLSSVEQRGTMVMVGGNVMLEVRAIPGY